MTEDFMQFPPSIQANAGHCLKLEKYYFVPHPPHSLIVLPFDAI
jgi:hypothetical protein